MEKETKKKKMITSVEFARESGIQVVHPSGTFLRRIVHEKTPTAGLKSMENDYKTLGIKDVQMNQICIVLIFESGKERHIPYAHISNFTVEEV